LNQFFSVQSSVIEQTYVWRYRAPPSTGSVYGPLQEAFAALSDEQQDALAYHGSLTTAM